MKTTSYEISKKLKEAGFEAETDYYFYGQQLRNSAFPSHSTDADRKVHVKSYELETILDALPKINKQEYLLCSGGIVYLNDDYISIGREKNESLADTAGKMWLLLKEKGLIC
jgi:hypothetical protein